MGRRRLQARRGLRSICAVGGSGRSAEGSARMAVATAGDRRRRATTLFEVEADARWRIWALFGLLVLVVWACLTPLIVLLAMLLNVEQRGSVNETAFTVRAR